MSHLIRYRVERPYWKKGHVLATKKQWFRCYSNETLEEFKAGFFHYQGWKLLDAEEVDHF